MWPKKSSKSQFFPVNTKICEVAFWSLHSKSTFLSPISFRRLLYPHLQMVFYPIALWHFVYICIVCSLFNHRYWMWDLGFPYNSLESSTWRVIVCLYLGNFVRIKGQMISKCPFSVTVLTKIPTRISALASKKRLNQKKIMAH